MLTFFFGAFGLSTLCLIPLLWRLGRRLMARGPRPPGGEGTIRFWLGALLVLLACATLEGLVIDHYTDDANVGGAVCRALAHAWTRLLGAGLSSVLMLGMLAAALPWYLGVPWRAMLGRVSVVIDGLATVLQHAVDRVASRRGQPRSPSRSRGAVRRVERKAMKSHKRQGDAVRRTQAPAPPTAAPVRAEQPLPPMPSFSPRTRQPLRTEKVIREPWLTPKHGRAPPTASMPLARAAPLVKSAELRGHAVVVPGAAAAHASSPRTVSLSAQAEAPSLASVDAQRVLASHGVAIEAPAEITPADEIESTRLPMPPSGVIAPARHVAANDDMQSATRADVVHPVMSTPTRPRNDPVLPPLALLAPPRPSFDAIDDAQLAETGELIEQRLREFKVPVSVVGASAGPVITRFEVEPAVGVRGNQIVALMKDLARGLGRSSVRVVETIPGKTCMGLELPNEHRQMIALSEILDSAEYRGSDSLLTLAMGKGITGEPVVADLAKAPHMLVAGTTGSGKSVAVNAMILSMLYKATPDDVRMIMIDPKMLELSVYEGIPHLLAPVVTDMKLAANALAWCVGEMENRYRLMSDLRVRNLAGFNQKVREARTSGRPLLNPFPAHPEVPETLDTLPMIVVVIDELADLMMVAGKKIEELIARLAQKARAAGIHLILATQRPSVDVITGLIKANIPTRVAFQVSSKIDSRTILDQMGAESLLGQGDMLFLPPGTGYPQRIHGAFVADEEVHRVVAHLKLYGEPDYKDEILAGPTSEGSGELFGEEGADAELDPLYDEAAAFVLRSRRASISFVQRQFRIGYNRAARLVEAMEAAGLVSSMGINGQRDVLAPGPSD